jgi:dipeptidyl aminopeptidase/acylaminoacyl peptidase
MRSTQAFSPDDLYLHHKVTDIDLAPADATAACAVKSIDRSNDGYLSCIWAFALDGSWQRQLTYGPGRDTAPTWSPQGDRLAFLSDRAGGGPQVHLLPRDGGEARQVGRFDQSVSDLQWAPDGRSLVVTAAVQVDPDGRGARGHQATERAPNAPEVAWKLPYKSDGIGYLLAREIHLFRVQADSGKCEQLSDGPFDVLGFGLSPNGRHIAYARTREGRFSHRTDLWVCDADGSRQRQLTRELAMVLEPAWSPDGRWLAFAGARQEGDAQQCLWLLEFATGELRQLGDDSFNVTGDALHWSADSRSIVTVRAHRGRHQVVRIAIDDGSVDVLSAGDRQLGAFAACATHLAYAVDSPAQPSELWCCRADGSRERQLSDFNPWWKERTPIQVEARQFRVPDGRGGEEVIEGWLLRAADAADGNKPLPLLNDVHGGPASYALLDFDTNVFWQVLCSRGWAVLALNAVGSASYGREFCDRLMGHWGEYDLPQHLAAVRQLQSEGVCDERVAISGKSYGGYLSSWAIGHTQLFRAAVVMAPVGNIETHYGTSDGGYYADPLYMGSGERFDRKLARQLSPLQHIEKARTPTLFLQGKEDERCPKCQSEELFVTLLRAGDTPAELVLYPNEHHLFLSEGAPSCRADAARRIVGWVNQHIAQETPAADPLREDVGHARVEDTQEAS